MCLKTNMSLKTLFSFIWFSYSREETCICIWRHRGSPLLHLPKPLSVMLAPLSTTLPWCTAWAVWALASTAPLALLDTSFWPKSQSSNTNHRLLILMAWLTNFQNNYVRKVRPYCTGSKLVYTVHHFNLSRHAEQVLFSCLGSKLTVYSRKLKWDILGPQPQPQQHHPLLWV